MVEETYCVTAQRRVVLMYCSSCQKKLIEKDKPVRVQRGRWNPILDHLKDGDSFLVHTQKDYDSVRGCMYFRNIPHRSAKMPDGTGWRIWKVNKDTAGQL
jgi:hypothetical protein